MLTTSEVREDEHSPLLVILARSECAVMKEIDG